MDAPRLRKISAQTAPRRGDTERVSGAVRYAGDHGAVDALHIAFARSPFGNGRLLSVDTEEAKALPGVVAVMTAADIVQHANLTVNPVIPVSVPLPFPLLAADHVAFAGQPVALVAAETAGAARDAADVIGIDVEPDENDTNEGIRVAHVTYATGDAGAAHEGASLTVRVRIEHPRLVPAPMEPRAASVAVEGDRLIVHLASQTPHRARQEMARIAGIDQARLQVVSTNVGGAFGQKASVTPEDVLTVMAAERLGRSVVFTAQRGEDFLAAPHGRATVCEGELSVGPDGQFLALSARARAEVGGWLTTSCAVPAWNSVRILPGPYALSNVALETEARSSASAPVGIYRGAGRPEAAMLMERLVDEAAAALDVDPLELRIQNVLPADALPHALPSGATLDSGNYALLLKRLAMRAGYCLAREHVARRRSRGEIAGCGIALYVEPSGSGWESARVRLYGNGTATVETGATVQGHTREDVFAAIAAEALELPADQVRVVHGDTDVVPEGIGALASRSTAIGGSAVHVAATRLAQRAREHGIPAEGLVEEERYTAPGEAWGAGAHFALVSICADTAVLTVERYVAVDDAGRILSPTAVRGQLEGGIAQGFGEAVMERVVYDAEGNLLTGSFMDYAMPRAADLDFIATAEVDHIVTPSPVNALGVKGVGEAGTIGAPAAIANAVHDALRTRFGRTVAVHPPFTPSRLWHAMKNAEESNSR